MAGLLDGLDDLDRERPGEPFTVRVAGRLVRLGSARRAGWRELLAALDDWPMFLELFGPDDDDDRAALDGLALWKVRALLRAWRVHHGLCVSDEDHRRLVALLSKPAYRSAISRDLHEVHGLDLTAEWQSRRWRRLLDLVDGSRRTSHLQEAMAQDDELAEALLESDDSERSGPKRRVIDFTAEVEVLSVLADRVAELIQVVGAGRGMKRGRVTPMPRPETALHRARERRTRRKHRYTVARVFGYVDAQGQPTGRDPQGGVPPSL